MYCAKCGVEDVKSSQFCRACGSELSGLRATLEQRPDTNPIVANTAREEIGRALADKIRQSENGADLRLVINDILPVAERFLETPEEKRLRSERTELETAQNALKRARRGIVVGAIGFAAAVVFLVLGLASRDPAWLIPEIPSIMGFLIGVAMILNALFFTASPAKPKGEILWGRERLSSANARGPIPGNIELAPEDQRAIPSVTEGTTRHL